MRFVCYNSTCKRIFTERKKTRDYKELSELIYPSLPQTVEDYEKIYPPRDLPEGAMVTRLGPSPTGFIHLGNLYGAFVDERLAHQSVGVF